MYIYYYLICIQGKVKIEHALTKRKKKKKFYIKWIQLVLKWGGKMSMYNNVRFFYSFIYLFDCYLELFEISNKTTKFKLKVITCSTLKKKK